MLVDNDKFLLHKFSADRKEKIYCDITLDVSGIKFECHKFLLGAVSRYFHGLFRHKFRDSCSNEIKLITPYGLTAPIFELVISFIYTENISLTEGNINDKISI